MSRESNSSSRLPQSFTEIVRTHALEQPEKWAFAFEADSADDRVYLTYRELDLRARRLAAQLQAQGLVGERALLLYPAGLDFIVAFFGCLQAGVVAVPSPVPRANRPAPRLRAIVDDCRPRAVLTISALEAESNAWPDLVPELGGAATFFTDRPSDHRADDWQDPAPSTDCVAFLQYTSGSTAASKGVMVTHENLLHNSKLIHRAFRSHRDGFGVCWLPLFHDMGLIGGMLQTLYCGGSSTLLSPVSFLKSPWRWLEAISRTGAIISGGPNFAYEWCVRKVTDEQRATLDLSCWHVAFNGAEPIRPETLEKFSETFAPCGFRREAFLPCYGLAETTLMVSASAVVRAPVVAALDAKALGQNRAVTVPAEHPHAHVLASSGVVAEGLRVVIADPETHARRYDGEIGEIWVSGPSVALGYWGRPDETRDAFHAATSDGDGPFLRTGDLGFLLDGQLYVTGRIKDMIIIRGRNVYPQDVERTVERAHAAIREEAVAAVAIEIDGEERLVVVAEVERQRKGEDPGDVIRAIRQSVAEEHELEVHAVRLVRALSIPKTSSGKIQRHACREGFLDGTLELVASSTDESAPTRREPAAPRREPAVVSRHTSREIEHWLIDRLARELRVNPHTIGLRDPFTSFGLGSLKAVEIAGDLERWLGRTLDPVLLYEYPTIETLAAFLVGERPSLSTSQRAPTATAEPIAIVGIGCRFPGASGPDAFWQLLREGRDATREVPADRWDVDALYDPGRLEPGKINVRRAGFLDEVDGFDADFFGISPREAVRIDPQQRLVLEVAWEALEDAGLAPDRLAGTEVGVFVGISTADYARLQQHDGRPGDSYALAGNAASIAANRLSYLLDLRGPSLAVDTACSSSLVAVQLACRSLWSGETRLGLAGGVNLILSPEVMAGFVQAGFLAPDGRCKAFDASANGFARGEGAGIVVLKRLSEAQADGDHIYAVIRGTAVNQDGKTNGLTAPNPHAQQAVLLEACRAAGVTPGQVQYVEAHGTGTLLGDPIEARALGTVLAVERPADRPCAIGTVKTNIGHLEAAAGIAGLIKVALAIKHGAIPPSLHFQNPNPHIPFAKLQLAVQRELAPWPESSVPPLAGVSSFGFGGTNAHVILEGLRDGALSPEEPTGEVRDVMLPLSARSPEALRELACAFRERLAKDNSAVAFHDIAAAAGARRAHHMHRLAVVAQTRAEARERLGDFIEGRQHPGVAHARTSAGRPPGLVFVFTGQGPALSRLGSGLVDSEPVFRKAIEECDAQLAKHVPWSLLAELSADEEHSRMSETAIAQPAVFALQVALAALWRSWGIVPDVVLGHSLGEVAAAHVAGALSLEDAIRIVVERGRLMQRIAGSGKTAAVGLSVAELLPLVNDHGNRLTIAAINGPGQTTVSGDCEAIEDLVSELGKRDVFVRVLPVDCAFHGPHMDPLQRELTTSLASIEPRATTTRLISTVTGAIVQGTDLGAEYWGRNLRETVQFVSAIEGLADEPRTFLEIGPHPALGSAIVQVLRGKNQDGVAFASLRRGTDDRESLLRSLAALYTQGRTIDWQSFSGRARHVALPTYPWQRERFWIDDIPVPPTAYHRSSVNGNGHSALHRVERNGHYQTNGHKYAHEDAANCVFGVEWKPKPRTGSVSGALTGENWLIFSDAGTLGSALCASLESRGARCIEVVPAGTAHSDSARARVVAPDDPAEYELVISEVLARCDAPGLKVVYLSGLDWRNDRETGAAQVAAELARRSARVVSLVRALAKAGPTLASRLWLITRGAQPVGAWNELNCAEQAPLWGLGRSVAVEHPALWGGLIDLDPRDQNDEVEDLVAEFIDPHGEDQVAFHGGVRHVVRLVRRDDLTHGSGTFHARPEGTYLITGGLGELGLQTAGWLVDRGARRLVLVGRRGLPARGAWQNLSEGDPARTAVAAIHTLEARGATVIVAAADVADEPRMAALFEQLAANLPPLRGIVHAAGVASEITSASADFADLSDAFRPKVAGTLVLDKLSRALPLDFLVCYSSAASVWGAKEPSYAAANAFLDAFVFERRSRGLTASSINWGPWSGGGMADTAGRARAFKVLGVRTLAADQAFRALGDFIASGSPQATIADADWDAFKSIYGQEGRRPLLDAIAPGTRTRRETSPGTISAPARWRDKPLPERVAFLTSYLHESVASVLGLDPSRLDADRPLNTLGLDSLMALELRSKAQKELDAVLPISALLDGPSINSLAARLAEQPVETPSVVNGRASSETDAIVEFPVSIGQDSLWRQHQFAPTSAAYNMSGAARIRADVNVDALRRTFQRLVERHAVLRTTFALRDSAVVQQVHTRAQVNFEAVEAKGWSDAQIGRRLEADARRAFDLEHGPLLRVQLFSRSAHEHFLLLSFHHIISDFWSFALLMDEIGTIYPAELAGHEPELEPLAHAYVDHVRAQAAMLAGPEGEEHWSYWKEQIAGPLPVIELATDRSRPAVQTFDGATQTLQIDRDLTRRLTTLAAEQGATLYVTILAAFQALLARYTGLDDIIVGSPVAGRTSADFAGVAGYFVNPLPIRSHVASGLTFRGFLSRVRASVLNGLEHQDFPFPLMVERLDLPRDPSRSPIFQVMFVFQKAQRLEREGLTSFTLHEAGPSLELGGLRLESMAVDPGVAHFDITLMAHEHDGEIGLSLEYNTDLFDAGFAARMLDSFRTLLEGAVAQPDARLAQLPVLSAAERTKILVHWNATKVGVTPAECVHRIFERQVERNPGTIAATFNGDSLTYAELNERANALAHHLQRLGVGPDVVVGLCLERSLEMVVGLLGILKAGGAYLPLDPNYPRERLDWMRSDSRARVIVTRSALRSRLPLDGGAVVCLDRDAPLLGAETATNLAQGPGLDNLAYVIYTSGSTGRPKGAMIAHRGLTNYLTWCARAYQIKAGAGAPVQSSISFDLTITALLGPLVAGRRVDLLDEALGIDALRLALSNHSDYSLVKITPAHLQILGQELPSNQAAGRTRAFVIGGEQLTGAAISFWQEWAPETLLVNEYGPTETVVGCCVYEVPRDERKSGAVPIGRPIANTRLYVLDAQFEPVPVGVAGELFIAGEGVARGYLNRPGLTAERFLPDPFHEEPGQRMYRTGDRARYRPDGVLECLGRVDDQVKVLGYRVELGEVEAALLEHPAVREAAVNTWDDPAGGTRLVGYVVLGPTHAITGAEIRRGLRERLPAFMVPSAVRIVDALPLSANGKIDRAKLPAPDPASIEPDTPYSPPRTPAEQALTRITAEVLGRTRIGVLDNLFDLGVDSIHGIQIAARMRHEGYAISPALLFTTPTIEAIAATAAATAIGEETAGSDPQVAAPTREPATGGEVYPLAPLQEGMLFHSRLEPEAGIYVQQLTCLLRGEVNLPAFVEAWTKVVDRHAVLRSAFERIDSTLPRQRVIENLDIRVQSEDWRAFDELDQEELVANYLLNDRRRGFDLSRPPLFRLALFRLSEKTYQLVFTFHHLLLDGWSLPIVLGDLLSLYEAGITGKSPTLPAVRPFRAYIDWLATQDLAHAEAFWREELRGFSAPTPLGIDEPTEHGAYDDDPFQEEQIDLSPELTAALRELARTSHVTLNTIVQGAWGLLLSRYSGDTEVLFGATTSGRPAELDGVESMVGLFINTLPVRVEVVESSTTRAWLRDVQRRQVELRRYEYSPLAKVKAWSEIPPGQPLFESIVIFENYPIDAAVREHAGNLGVHALNLLERTNYPLSLFVFPGNALSLRINYDTRRLSASAVDRMLEHVRTLLEGIANDPDRAIADLHFLTESERTLLLREWGSDSDDHEPAGWPIVDPADVARLSESELDLLLDGYPIDEEAIS